MTDRSGCLVAIDIGNTALKLSVRDSAEVHHRTVISLSGEDWAVEATDWVKQRTGCAMARWRIASVNRRATDQLMHAIGLAQPTAIASVISHQDVPMATQVDHPERLGIDRLIAAWSACRDQVAPMIIVDAGSAVTVDWVNEQGVFCGGAILPGLKLQTRSLAIGTDALPKIEWQVEHSLLPPGRNTIDAIRLGVLAGVAGAIDRLITLHQEAATSGDTANVIVTGGDAPTLLPYLRSDAQHCPHLITDGLLRLP